MQQKVSLDSATADVSASSPVFLEQGDETAAQLQ
jgi:hypothetical protein